MPGTPRRYTAKILVVDVPTPPCRKGAHRLQATIRRTDSHLSSDENVISFFELDGAQEDSKRTAQKAIYLVSPGRLHLPGPLAVGS